MVTALCQGFSILCLGKGCVVIFIKNLCPALVHFEIGNKEEIAIKRKGKKGQEKQCKIWWYLGPVNYYKLFVVMCCHPLRSSIQCMFSICKLHILQIPDQTLYILTFPPPFPLLVGSATFPCHDKYFSQDMPTGCMHVYTHTYLNRIQGPKTSHFWLQMVKKSRERTNPSQV